MNFSCSAGLTAFAALIAASGLASADVAVKGTYIAPGGVIVASTCGAVSASLAVGNTSNAVAFYPGPSLGNFTIVSPSTDPTKGAGSTAAYTCRAGTYKAGGTVARPTATWTNAIVPATGLNGASLPFACFLDTLAGPGIGAKIGTAGHAPTAVINLTINAAPTSDAVVGQTLSVETTEQLVLGGTPVCSYTTDATWFAK
jgi:hypothetical protein